MKYEVFTIHGLTILGEDVLDAGNSITIVKTIDGMKDLTMIYTRDVLMTHISEVTNEEYEEMLVESKRVSEALVKLNAKSDEIVDVPTKYTEFNQLDRDDRMYI